ncbi:putative eukaryotic translation initiation factor 4B1 [Iris pallida]|uniref:Eukaryotic translation initiation factor 4B1 n=1 Tax=Iris pallida TaxID=29817 RepID=A0AAX6FYE8_IRIPA|nr:putative eukaryotic translation initiation factor 4B1 [Iris pallida]
MSKPWGAIGAWALEAERAEAEEREHAAVAAAAPADLFPSLKEAVAAKPKKKKKPVAVPLSEFAATPSPMSGPAFGGRSHRGGVGLTPDEMLRLPTGPKERSAEELESSRFGRGFQSYGGGSGSGPGSGSRRSYGGGFDEEGRRDPPSRDPDLPSRADEVDNWASAKKPFPSDSGPGRHDRYGSLGGGSSLKADEADSWFSTKKAAPTQSRSSGFGSGFRDSFGGGSSDSDRWVRGGGGGGAGFPASNNNEERPRLVLDPPKNVSLAVNAEQVKNRPSLFGAARPREEVLAEKGVDWRKVDTEIEVKKSTSRPSSSHSSRPSSAQSGSRPGSPGEGGAPKARPKINPFGDARPREVLLQEKGKDWRKIDLELEHRSVDRSVTDEEKMLKEEINHLKKELSIETEGNLNGDPAAHSTEQAAYLHEQISQKERDLEKLIRDLDDKVRFGQKATSEMRPGSGAGNRPPSQSGMSEEPRNMEFTERPRSRGGLGDSWAKPMDDRRGFQGGRESSFFGSRNMDRSRRDGW